MLFTITVPRNDQQVTGTVCTFFFPKRDFSYKLKVMRYGHDRVMILILTLTGQTQTVI